MRKYFRVPEAISMNNGICFFSNRHKSHIAATIDEQGNITTELTTRKKFKSHKDKHEKIATIKEMSFLLIFSILGNLSMCKSPIYGMQTFLIELLLLLLGPFIVSTIRERREGQNWFKFHSAEHMVLNGYKKLKRVPSLEEIQQYSRYSNSCGTNKITIITIQLFLCFVCTFIPNPLYALSGFLATSIIVPILSLCGCLNFLQKFTTSTPTDKELLVAIAGLSTWLENEQKEKEKSRFSKFLHRLFPRIFH